MNPNIPPPIIEDDHKVTKRPTRFQDIAYLVAVITSIVLSNQTLGDRAESYLDKAVERLERENKRLHSQIDLNKEEFDKLVEAIRTIHPECKGLP